MNNSSKTAKWRRIMDATEVLKMPKRPLATFGPTNIAYCCLSALSERSTRIRSGVVFAERPAIILPNDLRQTFQGFEPQAREFAEELFRHFGDRLRALGYKFRHEPGPSRDAERPFHDAYQEILDSLNDENRCAVLRGPDAYWGISLMKFTLEMSAASFAGNIMELEERGLFNPEKRLKNQLELLFNKAERSAENVSLLAEFLKQNDIFEEYEDRFFDLIQRNRRLEQ
ncbi:MAG: hypothetical protein HYT79_11140 [Elusimicrobia bacterium]|nr:hypothetical protein [Elusimicrobiota bacterium]